MCCLLEASAQCLLMGLRRYRYRSDAEKAEAAPQRSECQPSQQYMSADEQISTGMHSCPSTRAGVASARRLRTRGPTDQWGDVWMPCARGAAPLSSSRQGSKPNGRDKRGEGSVHENPAPATSWRRPRARTSSLVQGGAGEPLRAYRLHLHR